MTVHIPAEAFPASEAIAEEMEARGWDAHEMETRMRGRSDGTGRSRLPPVTTEYVEGLLSPDHHMQPYDAFRLKRAFGLSAEFWLNVDACYWSWVTATTAPAEEGTDHA